MFNNVTTIENLDAERKKVPVTKEYNFNMYQNWISVFGKNKILWFIPLNLDSGKPEGDGVVFFKSSKIYENKMYNELVNNIDV